MHQISSHTQVVYSTEASENVVKKYILLHVCVCPCAAAQVVRYAVYLVGCATAVVTCSNLSAKIDDESKNRIATALFKQSIICNAHITVNYETSQSCNATFTFQSLLH